MILSEIKKLTLSKIDSVVQISFQRKKPRELRKKDGLQRKMRDFWQKRAKSHYVGTIGDRVDIRARYVKTAWFEVDSFRGWGTERMYIHTFKIGDDTLIWKTTSSLGKWNDKDEWEPYEEGTQVHLRATIKDHSEYDGEKQTILTRC